jgi:hypothetical protein
MNSGEGMSTAGTGAGVFYGLALDNAAKNAVAVKAAQDASDRGDTPGYQSAAALAAQTQSAGEFQRNFAIGLASALALSGAASLYLWLTGEDPDRYARKP